jgi:hypothetical protein
MGERINGRRDERETPEVFNMDNPLQVKRSETQLGEGEGKNRCFYTNT